MALKTLLAVFVMLHLCLERHSALEMQTVEVVGEKTCTPDWAFMCDNTGKTCINQTLVCNGVAECLSGRDESVETCGCLSNEFQCNNSHCIDMILRCDLNDDCEDGNDEVGCETYECPSTHFKCDNNYCIPREKHCDFIDDCKDNSDESTCDRRNCYHSEFRCNNSQCIQSAYLCDKVEDCLDGSDEDPTSCMHHLQCENGLYVHHNTVCDGWVDCFDTHRDETNCGPCSPKQFKCNNTQCIGKANVCDGFCDCITCEDEASCNSIECTPGRSYMCRKELRCIDQQYVCDGVNDCLDSNKGSDEYYCWNKSDHCAGFQDKRFPLFPCPDSGQCIPEKVKCDYIADCLHGGDERGCSFNRCADEEFRCQSGECIPKSHRCNGELDCRDRSDEVGCESYPCRDDQRRCDGGQCIDKSKWCDHWKDCPDNSDEKSCDYRKCQPEEFQCASGQCINMDVVCNNATGIHRLGCADGSHLINCSTAECNKPGQFKCRNSYCISESQRCNGKVDCLMTLWDERGCPYACPYYDPRCICNEEEMDCSDHQLTIFPTVQDKGLTKFRLPNNKIKITSDTFVNFDRLNFLDLRNNSIRHLPDGCFRNLWRLATLNLMDNQLTELSNATFFGLSGLKQLYLSGNRIETILPDAFFGLSHLKSLDLSGQRIVSLPQNAFLGLRNAHLLKLSNNAIEYIADGALNGLDKLLTLDLRGNVIQTIEKNVFHLQKLQTLYTDEYRFCCLAKGVRECYPEPDQFSSCEDLMSNYVLRVSIWILGMVASFGNLLVIGWRARDLRGGKVHSFLITNLAIGDFFMGVYLMIIAVVDSYYRGVYIIHDHFWRESDLCRFAGFISTFSSELSVFTLTVITLDRLICIIFPLRLKRLGLKEASVVMILVWIMVFIMSTLPLMGMDYFHNFYGRSGVCLALHVTPDRPPGWEYSVALFLVINFVSFLAIFLSYLWMFIVAKRTRRAVRTTENKSDAAMAKRMTLIVMTDFFCWVPIILLGFASLGGAMVPAQVYAWIAVFVLPLNSAINPVLYTISTAPFLGNVRKRANRFRKSFMSSFTMDTKHSYVDERSTSVWDRKSPYRHMDLIRMRNMNTKSDLHSQSDQSDY